MTADYLLTAQDLPGWQGGFLPIDYRQLLVKSIRELAHGLYGEDRICRELRILDHIAEQHGLRAFFRDQVRRTRRWQSRRAFEGTGVNANSLLLSASTYGIENVFDAAYAAHAIYTTYAEATLRTAVSVLIRSVAYRLRAARRGSRLPPSELWGRDASAHQPHVGDTAVERE
jgi:hypothetical protein